MLVNELINVLEYFAIGKFKTSNKIYKYDKAFDDKANLNKNIVESIKNGNVVIVFSKHKSYVFNPKTGNVCFDGVYYQDVMKLLKVLSNDNVINKSYLTGCKRDNLYKLIEENNVDAMLDIINNNNFNIWTLSKNASDIILYKSSTARSKRNELRKMIDYELPFVVSFSDSHKSLYIEFKVDEKGRYISEISGRELYHQLLLSKFEIEKYNILRLMETI